MGGAKSTRFEFEDNDAHCAGFKDIHGDEEIVDADFKDDVCDA